MAESKHLRHPAAQGRQGQSESLGRGCRAILASTVVWIALAIPSPAKGPPRPLDARTVAGVYELYKAAQTDGDVSFAGGTDSVYVVPESATRAKVMIDLIFRNGHVCLIGGTARVTGPSLPLHGREIGASGLRCELVLHFRKGAVRVEDRNRLCRAYTCGAVGHYHDAEIKRRGPLRKSDWKIFNERFRYANSETVEFCASCAARFQALICSAPS